MDANSTPARTTRGTRGRLATAADYVELLPTRPVLFPERTSSKGKKYAKKLTARTNRAVTFEGDVTRKARALLARYEGATR